jgi:hypothetical protein
MDQFSYYMIRIRHSATEDRPEPLVGVVERLGSGEKQGLGDGDALLLLLSGWTYGLPNMRTVNRGGET